MEAALLYVLIGLTALVIHLVLRRRRRKGREKLSA